jgi:hypothetical protein
LIAVCFLALWYGHTAILRRCVTSALAKWCTGLLELDQASYLPGPGLVLRGLRLHATTDPSSAVVCRVDRVEIECTWWDLISRRVTAKSISVRGAQIRLEGADPARWLSQLPIRVPSSGIASYPTVNVAGGKLALGSREYSGLDLAITPGPDGKTLRLRGSVDDPLWRRWSFTGTTDMSMAAGRVHAECDELELRPELANLLAADVRSVFDRLQPNGRVSVVADLTWHGGTAGGQDLRLLVDPRDLALTLPTVPQPVTGLSGRIEWDGTRLVLHSLAGRLGGGDIVVRGSVDVMAPYHARLNGELRGIRVGDLLQGGDAPTLPLDSLLSGDFQFEGGNDAASWRGGWTGTLKPPTGSPQDAVQFRGSLADGVATIDEIRCNWAGGELTAKARAALTRAGNVTGTLTLRGARIEQLLPDRAKTSDIEGTASADLRFEVPAAHWSDWSRWTVSGSVSIPAARVEHREIRSAIASVEHGTEGLRFRDASLEINGLWLRGFLTVSPHEPFRLSGTFQTDPMAATALAERFGMSDSLHGVSGVFTLDGSVSGTLRPLQLMLAGNGLARELQIGEAKLARVPFEYKLDGETLAVSCSGVPALGGQVDLRAETCRVAGPVAARGQGADGHAADKTWTPVATAPEIARIDFRGKFDRLDLVAVAAAVGRNKLRTTGRISGSFEASVPLSGPQRGQILVHGEGSSAALVVDGTRIEQVAGDFVYDMSGLAVPHWSGNAPYGPLAGSIHWDREPDPNVVRLQVSSNRLSLDRLAGTGGSSAVRGTASFQMSLVLDAATGASFGSGTARSERVACGELPPFGPAQCDIEVEGPRVTLRRLDAPAWGGKLTAGVVADLSGRAPSEVTFVLEKADLRQMAGAWSTGPPTVRGTGSARGTLLAAGHAVRTPQSGGPRLEVQSAVIAGIPVKNGRAELELVGDRATLHAVSAAAAEGVVTGEIRLQLPMSASAGPIARAAPAAPPPVGYEASLTFWDISVPTMLRSAFAIQQPVAGVVSGQLELRGTTRSWQDTAGEIRIRELRDADLWRMPLFAMIADLMLPGRGRGVFHTGNGVARLRDGRATVDGFALAGPTAQLFVDKGTIGFDGRLDLEVIGNAETLIPAQIPVIGLFRRATDMLQQNLVKYYVTGTLENPRVVPVPLAGVSEAAARFFTGLFAPSSLPRPASLPRPIPR